MTTTIRPVRTKRDLKTFITCTRHIYRDDPNWIQPLTLERLDALQAHKNPYFNHAEVAFWLAERNGHVVGRVSAQSDRLAQDRYGTDLAHFGFFEAEDFETARALMETAEAWARQRGLTRVQGPWSLSANEQAGLLVDGFNTPPVFMMPHGRPDYDGWLKDLGYGEARDMLAYELDLHPGFPEKTHRIVKLARRNKRLNVRELDMKHFDRDLALIMDIFNEAWSDNWGYVPFTEEEAAHAAKALKPIVKPYRTMIAEVDGEPAAFMVTIPDVNHKIRDLNGKLTPIGLAKLLWRLILSGREDRMRVPLMGVRKAYQRGPIGAALAIWMISDSRDNVVDRGATFGELGWILEDNDGMNKILTDIGCKPYKTYRVYEKGLA
ncbi:GNAT family N-acetyltransferase [Yunchengibacter salinarum]|uniref:GNAT family N-acetyltransferase n=1 Tax=Yunchengibacter salinarum TaxID=3133399 RepID=UPI0035B5DFE7